MRFTVTVAVIAGWYPKWQPPIGDHGFDTSYPDRLKVEISVDEDESLESVYARAIAAFQPHAVPGPGAQRRPIDTVFWAMFYEPSDEGGIGSKLYETPSDLVLVGRDGLARWRRDRSEIRYGDIVRSGEHGLLRGDPLRPYLYLQLPQGGGGFDIAWTAMLHAWEVLEGLYVTGQTAVLLNNIRKRLTGRHVLEANAEDLQSRGGGPMDVIKTIRDRTWVVGDLRSIMGLETEEQAVQVLELVGCTRQADGRYRFSTDSEESKFLSMAADDVFRLVIAARDVDDELLRERFESMLRDGSPPPL